MPEILRIGAYVPSILGLLGFIAGLIFWAYRLRLKADLSHWQGLPDNRRAETLGVRPSNEVFGQGRDSLPHPPLARAIE
jgi:hypothetical protein